LFCRWLHVNNCSITGRPFEKPYVPIVCSVAVGCGRETVAADDWPMHSIEGQLNGADGVDLFDDVHLAGLDLDIVTTEENGSYDSGRSTNGLGLALGLVGYESPRVRQAWRFAESWPL
jgi:hypothetical protein